jgi:DNA-binding response OmpR family regulator
MNILLVEDNAELCNLIRERLVTSGHQVVVAENGARAFEWMRQMEFETLISDILMPEKDGLEVIEEFRRCFPAKRIVAMSGGSDLFGSGLCLDLARRLGAYTVLYKPFTMSELMHAVDVQPRVAPTVH